MNEREIAAIINPAVNKKIVFHSGGNPRNGKKNIMTPSVNNVQCLFMIIRIYKLSIRITRILCY